MTDLPLPSARLRSIGQDAVEARIRAAMDADALSHGWLIVGPKGAGKATLAFRAVRALLDPASLEGPGLDMPATARTFRLIAAGAHPDLFIAQRRYDEKTERQETEITIETIRKLTSFLNRTASEGGARVAIIDTADEMNRNAANALLKSLEEPPANAALFLLCEAPGRLPATIRSRCRRIDLRPAMDEVVSALLQAELGLGPEEATQVARAAGGWPGRALALAAGEGVDAVRAADEFLAASAEGRAPTAIAARMSARAATDQREIFARVVLDRIAEATALRAMGAAAPAPFARAAPGELAEALEELTALLRRGDAVNADRAQLILAMSRRLSRALEARAA